MTYDLILVGGGLANCLIAYRLATARGDVKFVVLERGNRLGGDHTWSFHEHDVTPEARGWLDPLVQHSWSSHSVSFPDLERTLNSGYSTIFSKHLAETLEPILGERVRCGAEVRDVEPEAVRLADGTVLRTAAVIDGRGDPRSPHLDIGYQKFVGRFVTTVSEHGLTDPVLMDATVPQLDGFRFVYTLPLSADSLLVEDTYYSDTPDLDSGSIRRGLDEYIQARSWQTRGAAQEESGVLPIVLSGDIEAFWNEGPEGVARSGMRAALFHPTTGYSLPEAVRLADDLVGLESLAAGHLARWTRRRSESLWRSTGYFRLLNRMLFRAADPDQRYRVLERFYRLGEPLIRRFYAGRLRWTDKIRLVTGSPPVPIGRALKCVLDRRPRPTSDAP